MEKLGRKDEKERAVKRKNDDGWEGWVRVRIKLSSKIGTSLIYECPSKTQELYYQTFKPPQYKTRRLFHLFSLYHFSLAVPIPSNL